MRKLIVTVFLSCHGMVAIGQQCIISAKKENIVYIGLPNPIDIAVEGRLCKDFTVVADNGIFEKGETSCSYFLSPAKAGKVEISVKEKKQGKVIGKAVFRVREIPPPTVKLAGKSGGNITKSVLKVQVALSVMLEGFDFDARFVITKYRVSIFRGEKLITTGLYTDPRFPPALTDVFGMVQKDDKLVFSDMAYLSPGKTSGVLQPIEFIISE